MKKLFQQLQVLKKHQKLNFNQININNCDLTKLSRSFFLNTMDIKTFFTDIQQKSIQLAIENAELNTSGEIRVHLDSRCKGDSVKVATSIFEKLKMHETELRNGVLFYLAVEDRKFAIIGDKGINDAVETE